MDEKQIIWSKRAESELKQVLNFYIERNKSKKYSLKLLDEVEKMVGLLTSFPYIGRISDNGITRVVVKEKFLIFYEIYINAILIVSFWDGRQSPQKRIDFD
ncbi:MAG: type II toxin-antitoxin system RelE/ParE family toxin [Bacteroidetes bacterium]|nr:type II toxin-antitoxin system RelE/ParE family toxin [Bacteroidota bacterium]